jgi:hypothetical protein
MYVIEYGYAAHPDIAHVRPESVVGVIVRSFNEGIDPVMAPIIGSNSEEKFDMIRERMSTFVYDTELRNISYSKISQKMFMEVWNSLISDSVKSVNFPPSLSRSETISLINLILEFDEVNKPSSRPYFADSWRPDFAPGVVTPYCYRRASSDLKKWLGCHRTH